MKTVDLNAPNGAEQLADALAEVGIQPGDEVRIVTPQFERTPSQPPPPSIPSTDEEWRALAKMTMDEAVSRGFGNWDGGLALLPGEWFAHIPAWFEVVCIVGTDDLERWGDEQRDDDIRFGFLPYGILLEGCVRRRDIEAPDLDSLCQLVNMASADGTLDTHYFDDFPVFGGERIEDVQMVRSWDRTRALLEEKINGQRVFSIVPRSEVPTKWVD